MKNVIIPNPKRLKEKIAKFKKAGANDLFILADFNKTFTKAFVNGEKTPSLIAQLRNGKYLTKNYAERANDLYNKYHPIEISKEISLEEKKAKMLEWWKVHYALLITSGLDEKTIKLTVEDMIREGRKFRPHIKELFRLLKSKNIPVIIMSAAGIGNMVNLFLKKKGILFDNLHFIGNTLEFDKNGKFKDIKEDKIIHVLNKQAIETKGLPVYEKIKNRKSIILLGDSMDDLEMTHNFPYNSLIKIGFFNFPDEATIEDFKNNFDLIITRDGSFEAVNKLLKEILI
ncbi:MAG: hypothetical protein WC796_03335 [Candidatus Pacearchaeota archaeon]|jgi:5'-nucleotidase